MSLWPHLLGFEVLTKWKAWLAYTPACSLKDTCHSAWINGLSLWHVIHLTVFDR